MAVRSTSEANFLIIIYSIGLFPASCNFVRSLPIAPSLTMVSYPEVKNLASIFFLSSGFLVIVASDFM